MHGKSPCGSTKSTHYRNRNDRSALTPRHIPGPLMPGLPYLWSCVPGTVSGPPVARRAIARASYGDAAESRASGSGRTGPGGGEEGERLQPPEGRQLDPRRLRSPSAPATPFDLGIPGTRSSRLLAWNGTPRSRQLPPMPGQAGVPSDPSIPRARRVGRSGRPNARQDPASAHARPSPTVGRRSRAQRKERTTRTEHPGAGTTTRGISQRRAEAPRRPQRPGILGGSWLTLVGVVIFAQL